VSGTEPINGWIALLLYIVISPAFCAYIRVSITAVWRANAAT